ncbi:phosphatidate cytidylyltransferase [Candidatus Pelagibacter sp.]|nr:phosphatidate cytidylyltransferase [Candidatus Pelagibacter sp.]
MSKELKKRFQTSILLFLIVLFVIFVNNYIFIFSVFLVSCIAFNELNKLIIKIFKKNYFTVYITSFFLVSFLFTFLIISIQIHNIEGAIFFLYILLICIFTDIGGYVVGKLIGGKKLTKISPNKTISGSIGSFIFSIIPLIFFLNMFFQSYYSISLNEILFCLSVSLVSQLGDLCISYIKRKGKVKDTGSILPGHGGLVDRIDGMIFAIPFAGFYLYGFSIFLNIEFFLNSFIK